LPFTERNILDVGRRDGLDPAFLQRLFDGARNQVVHHVVMDLLAEALFDDVRGDLAGTEAGQPCLLRIPLGHAIDLRVDDVARDLDGDLLLSLADVLEFGFHQKVNAKGGTRTPIPFRVPDPKSGASASSATFASTQPTMADMPGSPPLATGQRRRATLARLD